MIKEIKKNNNYLTKNQQGITLVELVIYVALFGLVLAGIYNFYHFSNRGSMSAHAESEALQDARLAIMQIEREIRQANRPINLSDLIEEIPESKRSIRAVTVINGDTMIVYTYIGSEPKMVTYRTIEDSGFTVMERSVDDPHIIEPSNWEQIFDNLVAPVDGKYFEIIGSKIIINFSLIDPNYDLSRKLNIYNTFTVRGKDAMQ